MINKSKSKSKSKRKSRRKSKSFLNNFFNKIFVISLYDQYNKFEKVQEQFNNRNINVERFIAVDGRCKKEGDNACKDKIKSFEIMFDIKISNKNNLPLKELVPASSLTIGTILLLRKMVKEKWNYILICEDDIELINNFEKKFEQGIKEIGDYKWDILYLGCGGKCGFNGISEEFSKDVKYLSELGTLYEDEYYISNPLDLRYLCEGKCKEFSEHLSHPIRPGGTWAYAYSLKGAKKVLKLINDDAGNHIDKILMDKISSGKELKVLAFDPPIIYHENIIDRTHSNIPWEW